MKSYILKLTSAIAVDGQILRAGSLVELSELEAKNLLSRGKATLATVEDRDDEGTTDLSKLKKDQLLDLAKKLEIEGADKMKVPELISAIEAAQSEAE